ncbi:DUF1840 domain-containing protein [Solimicrobium silvestre]|uniref:DUF1840 domain-containing protein n=1 Tax=Solimicrobium silvestre TaxID=2099400 RepID=A0A2S9H037_9BURK|nr:DUF1840 domain-containing protein [Solimicrobium silvestre]PRC93313.1 hypothetical protein S2091_2051 [Solimicrobium silvestre]
MLITFKCKASPDIVMYKEHAQRILELLDKDVERGIIMHTDTTTAIATIEAAIADSRAHSVTEFVQHDITAHPQPSENGDHVHERVENVSFASRAFPFLQMLRAANAQGSEIVWGV